MLRAPSVIAPSSPARIASILFSLLHSRSTPFPHRSVVAAAAAAQHVREARPPLSSSSCSSSLSPLRALASMAHTSGAASTRTWEDVLNELSELITFKTRADGKGWRDAFENMPVYLEVRRRAAAAGSVVGGGGGGASVFCFRFAR